MAVRLRDTITTVDAAVSDAMEILSGLRDEVREARESMPESLQSGSRADALQEAEDALEQYCDESPEEELDEDALELRVVYGSNHRKNQTRSDRRDEAVRMLDAAAMALRTWVEEDESEDRSQAEAVADRVEEIRDEAEGVEFPGR